MDHHIPRIVFSELCNLWFWQIGWFKVTALITISSIALGFFRYRLRKLKNQNADLRRQISERSELLEYSNQKEKKAREIAAQANRTKSFLLARINHEIRTPLNGVLGMASLMGETQLTEEQREYNETIRECGGNLLKVVNEILLSDILEYSKVESGKMDLEQKDFDFENCIEEAFDVFAGKAGKAGLELLYEIDKNVPTQIVGDIQRLRQVLMNLVENSIRFTREGEILVRVHLLGTGEGNSNELAFEVRDTGAGIPEDKLRSISDEIASPNPSQRVTGVGLIICKKLIELMGGNLRVESQPGKGTTVTFTIRTVPSLHLRTQIADMAGMEGKRIMIVEDNVVAGNIIKTQLERWKLEPILVHRGNQVMELLQEIGEIDLLITDSHMPQLDGADLARSVKQQYPHLPVILLASQGTINGKAYPEFVNAVVEKPLRKHVLSQQILSCLRHPDRLSSNETQNISHTLSSTFSEEYPLRILVAEDNITNQKLAIKILGKLGYKPQVAKNGKEVLELVSDKNYDLILMDVQMPDMDGLEASRMIRLCLTAQPVIIAMTANTLQGDRETCLQAGMDDYISKPINLQELVDILEKWSCRIRERAIKTGKQST
jgi:signal transduction histidine kinase/CheY-like chemotaxis protein